MAENAGAKDPEPDQGQAGELRWWRARIAVFDGPSTVLPRGSLFQATGQDSRVLAGLAEPVKPEQPPEPELIESA